MQKTVLVILDGWGYRKATKGNAITPKTAPFFFSLLKKYPWTLLDASGGSVGVPRGTMGNSEVGHITIGAGRVIKQSLVKINDDIQSGTFFRNRELLDNLKYAKKNKKSVHIIGLVSDGNVHSSADHILALVHACKNHSIANVFVHAITDGRDTAPTSAIKYLTRLEKKMKVLQVGKIATIIGRYYAMDRDNRWERQKNAYDLFTSGKGVKVSTVKSALEDAYNKGEADELLTPKLVDSTGIVREGDVVIFANFRPDRMRQLTSLFDSRKLHVLTMTKYDEKNDIPALYSRQTVKDTIGECISRKGLKQLRIAETEKYAHVTYFFNGMREKPFPKEKRILVPSSKVSTYDKKPEMSAQEITDVFLTKSKKYDFVLLNFANADMVGHTGNFKATCQGVGVVDACLQRIVDLCVKTDRILLITADHGNAEEKEGNRKTSHTTNKVPFLLVSSNSKNYERKIKRMKGLEDIKPFII